MSEIFSGQTSSHELSPTDRNRRWWNRTGGG